MKKLISLIVVLVVAIAAFSLGFKDVTEDYWAYDYVTNLTEKGIIPTDEDSFNGFQPLTRADASVWLTRLLTYVENSPMIAKYEDIQRVENLLKATNMKSEELAKQLEGIPEFEQRITRNILKLKYDSFGQIDELNSKIKELDKKIDGVDQGWKKYEDLLKSVQASYNDVKMAAYRGKNMANSLTEDLLDLQDQLDEATTDMASLSSKVEETNKKVTTLEGKTDHTMIWIGIAVAAALGVAGIIVK
ncbi:hypothetical protein OSSY52_22510 [Tepiditoga spiralis]|uniref:SLH domain-containing protein n=1 Tax=Tepiditoga spiralis TaxID=2108365 RepID=A0A7G1G681_9BACT|nr:S-layer homology domain-containing protein [Tepiditoga spiralis]BBE32110.1 hypothetical protein OSSY52_22510 [Tepiditoga spiralis]